MWLITWHITWPIYESAPGTLWLCATVAKISLPKGVIFEPEKQRGCYREAPVCSSRMPWNAFMNDCKMHDIKSGHLWWMFMIFDSICTMASWFLTTKNFAATSRTMKYCELSTLCHVFSWSFTNVHGNWGDSLMKIPIVPSCWNFILIIYTIYLV